MHMGVAEEAIINSTGRVEAPLECWGCTNSPRYHADRFYTYRNCPNNMDSDLAYRAKQSIQEYVQRNSAMGDIRGYQGIQYGRGQKSSTTTCSTFVTRRAQLYQLWNKGGFRSVDQLLLMCEMVDPSTSRSA